MPHSLPTAEVIDIDGCQAVKLPPGIRLGEAKIYVRRAGDSIILEPLKPADAWPPGFFEAIAIDDPAFVRPDQGPLPPAPSLD